MTDFEQEFLDLFLDDGALTLLSQAADRVRNIILDARPSMSSDEFERLGHCGIASEYSHGIGFIHQLKKSYERCPELTPLNEVITKLTSCFEKSSQLANSPKRVSKELHKNENCFDAIPRAIEDASEWVQSNLTAEHNAKASALLMTCEEQYKVVRSFAERAKAITPL